LVRFADASARRAQSFLLYFRQLAVPKLVKSAGSETRQARLSVGSMSVLEMTSRKFRQNGEMMKSGI
jgi:hypothetical protein